MHTTVHAFMRYEKQQHITALFTRSRCRSVIYFEQTRNSLSEYERRNTHHVLEKHRSRDEHFGKYLRHGLHLHYAHHLHTEQSRWSERNHSETIKTGGSDVHLDARNQVARGGFKWGCLPQDDGHILEEQSIFISLTFHGLFEHVLVPQPPLLFDRCHLDVVDSCVHIGRGAL